MNTHFHAVVWLDHREAKIFTFNADDAPPQIVAAGATGHHLQHKANITGSGHKGVDKVYFDRLVAALEGYGAILLAGPGNAKLEFKNFIDEHALSLAKRISAVETLDHPGDAEMLTLGRRFFRVEDRLRVFDAKEAPT